MIDATLLTIHGFWSSPSTWERLEAIWRSDGNLNGLQITPFGYPTPKRPRFPLSAARVPGYDDVAQVLAAEYTIRLAGSHAIIVVTHSQGGLILQRFLSWMLSQGRGRELSRIRSVVMLACPNGGSEYLRTMRRSLGFTRHPQAGSLAVLDRQVADTQRTVLQRIAGATGIGDQHCQIPVHVYAGASDNIVTPASAQGAFPHAATLPGDHFSILDPASAGNRTAETVRHHIITDLAAGPGQHSQAPGIPQDTGTASGYEPGGKFRVTVQDSYGLVIGDHATVTQSFGVPPARPGNSGPGQGPSGAGPHG